MSARKPGPVGSDTNPAPGRVLVVGGAGFVGSVLVRDLLDRGYAVSVLDAFMYGDDGLMQLYGKDRLRVVQGDIRDVESVVRAMRDADAVVHLGGLVGDPACALDEQVTLDINLHATRTLAWVARGLGVPRFIFASSCSIYGASDGILDELSPLAPVSVYAQSKCDSEQLLLALSDAAFAPCVLRFGTLYGLSSRPRFDLVVNLLTAKAVTDGRITVFGGDQWRPFLHVSDAALAVVRALECDVSLIRGEVFNVGSDSDNHTLAEMAALVAEQVAGAEVELHDAAEVEANYRVSFAKIRDRIGFATQCSLGEGIAEIRDAVLTGDIEDYLDARYSNHKTLVAGTAALLRR